MRHMRYLCGGLCGGLCGIFAYAAPYAVPYAPIYVVQMACVKVYANHCAVTYRALVMVGAYGGTCH